MAIILLHTPHGIVEVDSETVTDAELAQLGVKREAFNKLLPPPSFHPPVFTPPDTGIAERVAYIEGYLKLL